MFASIEHGDTLDNRVMVAGYVIMRVALIFRWWEVSRHDAERAQTAKAYMLTIGTAQVGWVVLAVLELPIVTTFALFGVLLVVELIGPSIAERRGHTPWHAHHIAERYGLLVMITLGEVIAGTVASLNALVHGEAGWTVDAALLAVAGIGLAFSCWWMYFAVPWAQPLVRHRERAFSFGYGHVVLFAALAAMGAGLHAAISVLAFYYLYSLLVRTLDPFPLGLIAASAALLALSVLLAAAGVGVAIRLLVLMHAPAVTVAGYETVGHRHMAVALERL